MLLLGICFVFFWSRGWKRWDPGERRGHEGKQKEKRSVGMWHDNGIVVAVSVWEVSSSTHFVLLSVISSLIWTLLWITNPGCLFPSLPWSSFSSSSSSSSSPPSAPQTTARRPKVSPVLKVFRASHFSHIRLNFLSLFLFFFTCDCFFTSCSNLCVSVWVSVAETVVTIHHHRRPFCLH